MKIKKNNGFFITVAEPQYIYFFIKRENYDFVCSQKPTALLVNVVDGP